MLLFKVFNLVVCLTLHLTAEASARIHSAGSSFPEGFEEQASSRSLLQGENVGNKIVGGYTVSPGSYPFIASLRRPYRTADAGAHFCGGALVSENVVVTAAHCLNLVQGKIDVHVGRHDRDGWDGGRFEAFTVTRSVVHPLYGRGANLNYDVALLVLDGKSSTKPVELRTSDACFEGANCGFGEVFGWGWTTANEKNSLAKSLRAVRIPLVSRQTCRQHYGTYRITYAMVCAGGDAGQDSCQGDSGGPLLVINKLSGLVSFGASTCGARHPGVYTNIALVHSWIRNEIWSAAKTPSSQASYSQHTPSCRYINGRWYPPGC